VNLQDQVVTLGRRDAIPATVGPGAAALVLATPRRALLQPLRRREARGGGTPPRLPLYPVRITVNGFLKPF
jgi:hypothetical protein